MKRLSYRIPKNEEILAYIAGIVDGEGCVQISKNGFYKGKQKYQASLSVVNTDKRLIEFLYQQIGGGFYKRQIKKGWKPVYTWWIRCKGATDLLKKLLPYLILKKEQAKILIKFGKTLLDRENSLKVGLSLTCGQKRLILIKKMYKLNKKGAE